VEVKMVFKPEKNVADKAAEILNGGKIEDFLKNSMSQKKESKFASIPIFGDKLDIASRIDDLISYFKSPDVPKGTKVMILAMVIYMFIPNLPIPFYIDELLVGGLLVKKIHKELDAFRRGEYSRDQNVVDMKAVTAKDEEKRNPFLDLDDVVVEDKENVKKENPFLNI
jgi:uncharacterized membrane protein YkvA (DUF1232 family)